MQGVLPLRLSQSLEIHTWYNWLLEMIKFQPGQGRAFDELVLQSGIGIRRGQCKNKITDFNEEFRGERGDKIAWYVRW